MLLYVVWGQLWGKTSKCWPLRPCLTSTLRCFDFKISQLDCILFELLNKVHHDKVHTLWFWRLWRSEKFWGQTQHDIPFWKWQTKCKSAVKLILKNSSKNLLWPQFEAELTPIRGCPLHGPIHRFWLKHGHWNFDQTWSNSRARASF